jgi:membrane fusion protein, multidrug efflux system
MKIDMNEKKKNIKLMLLTILIHISVFIAGGYVLLNLKGEQGSDFGPGEQVAVQDRPEFVTVQTSQRSERIEISGRVRAENRLEIFPEVQGKVVAGNKPFREGVKFETGETIIELDHEEALLELYSSRSGFQTLVSSLLPDIKLDYPEQMATYERWFESLHPEKPLPALPDFDKPQLERFMTSRGVYDRYYRIRSAETRMEKFTVRAPFAGVLSSAKAEPGQSVGPQVHMGTFVDPDSYLVTATVRQSQLRSVRNGDTVELTDQNRTGSWVATVTRINPSVEPRSQAVEIYLKVDGNGIREGMYLDGILEANEPEKIAEIPKSALLRNGYVYAVRDEVVRQIPVRVIDIAHHTVRVTGLDDGEYILRDATKALTGRIVRED